MHNYSGYWDHGKVLTGLDVAAKKDGVAAQHFGAADEIILWFKRSKTDQQGAGAARNHYRAGGEICPVWAAECYNVHFPARMGSGAEASAPLARWQDGSPVTRQRIQEELQRAAVLEGYPPATFGSHSLRIGSAAALYHHYGDTEVVKRWGRWSSSAFHRYLWEGNETARGVSQAMADSVATLQVGYDASRERHPRRGRQRRAGSAPMEARRP